MSLSPSLVNTLVEEAQRARNTAYAPFSHFNVGAALLCEDGTIIRGCNIEFSVYGLTNCAERTALHSAIALGHRSFQAIAIAGDGGGVPPCGMCRQALTDFNPQLDVILVGVDGTHRIVSLAALFPEPFSTSFLHGSNTD